jgi:hypothetical protein
MAWQGLFVVNVRIGSWCCGAVVLRLAACCKAAAAWFSTLQAVALSDVPLLGAGHYATPQLRHLLLENFGVFGPIRSIYIVPTKTIAFVKFHWRVSAEFAKEAMDSQPLSGSSMKEVSRGLSNLLSLASWCW